MRVASLLLLSLANLGCLAFALKLLLARRYFPYHQRVTGKRWEDLGGGERTVFLGLMRLVGGGLLGAALTGGWLIWLLATGSGIPALLTVLPGLVIGVATLFVTSMIIRNGGTGAPRLQAGALVGLAVAGVLLWHLAV